MVVPFEKRNTCEGVAWSELFLDERTKRIRHRARAVEDTQQSAVRVFAETWMIVSNRAGPRSAKSRNRACSSRTPRSCPRASPRSATEFQDQPNRRECLLMFTYLARFEPVQPSTRTVLFETHRRTINSSLFLLDASSQ